MGGSDGQCPALIRQKQPNTLCVHCATHYLNVVIYNAVKCSVGVESYFTNLENIHICFENSVNK